MSAAASPALTPETCMRDLLERFPGAQRALFARYHIGGCQSCGFQPTETLAEVCARNEEIPVDEAIALIIESHDADSRILISPEELEALSPSPHLLDVRTREEYEAVHLPGAELMSQELLNKAFGTWEKESPIVVYDHMGTRGLDAAAYLLGHGFSNARALEGGIDAYAQEIDPSLPRYRVEFDD